jgi:hypothetical protein
VILWNQGISSQDKEGSMNDYEKALLRFAFVFGEDMNTYTDGSGSALTPIHLFASLNSRVVFEFHTHILEMVWVGLGRRAVDHSR